MESSSLTVIHTTQRRHQVNFWRITKTEASHPNERRLPQQLKQIQRKSDPFKFPLGHDNDIIAMPSNWGERLRLPKCDKKDHSQVWATPFPTI